MEFDNYFAPKSNSQVGDGVPKKSALLEYNTSSTSRPLKIKALWCLSNINN
jgi:hypothetical protein